MCPLHHHDHSPTGVPTSALVACWAKPFLPQMPSWGQWPHTKANAVDDRRLNILTHWLAKQSKPYCFHVLQARACSLSTGCGPQVAPAGVIKGHQACSPSHPNIRMSTLVATEMGHRCFLMS
jgi:hypothetical protein